MFRVYIGLRGVGKSSHAAKIAQRNLRKGRKVYSNFPCSGCYLYNVSDLGKYQIDNGVLILDEAGIDANNRSYKSFSKDAIEFWKLTRHYGIEDIYVYSQAFDFDITLRRLADKMYLMKKGIFNQTVIKPMFQFWDVDDQGQPVIKWKIASIIRFWFFRRPYYKYFNSYDARVLQHKDFELVPQVEHKSFVEILRSARVRLRKQSERDHKQDSCGSIV